MCIFNHTTARTSTLLCGIPFGCGSNTHLQHFLGSFTKLQKVTISYVMSVCLSARKEQLVSHIFMKFDTEQFSKMSRKLNFH